MATHDLKKNFVGALSSYKCYSVDFAQTLKVLRPADLLDFNKNFF